MPDVVTYCKSGYPILNGGVVTNVTMFGTHQYYGPTGVWNQQATGTYNLLELKYTDRFDDPRYYEGDAAG